MIYIQTVLLLLIFILEFLLFVNFVTDKAEVERLWREVEKNKEFAHKLYKDLCDLQQMEQRMRDDGK